MTKAYGSRALLCTILTAGGLIGSVIQAAADEFINILTGGTSGVYYPMGVALSKIYGEKIPSARALRPGDQGLGREPQSAAARARARSPSRSAIRWRSPGRAMTRPVQGASSTSCGLRRIYPNYIQIVASKESGIKTLADLKGKRLSVGAPKSGTELNARAILAAAGLTYKDLGKTEYLPFAESVELMKNRQFDATLQSAGLGVAAIRDLASSVEIVVVEVPGSLVDKVGLPTRRSSCRPTHIPGKPRTCRPPR